MHQVTGALAENKHKLAQVDVSVAVKSYFWVSDCTLAFCFTLNI